MMFKFQAILSEIRRTGGGVAEHEVLESLTRADQLALAYLGIENADGNKFRHSFI